MQGAIDSLNAGVVLVDERGAVSAWSRGVERELGIARDRALGQPWSVVLETLLAPLLDQDIRAALASVPGADEEPVSARFVPDENQALTIRRTLLPSSAFLVELSLASSRDLSERKRAEEALRVSDERYRAMFERNKAMKWIVDPSDGRILDVNEAAASFYGYSKDELLTMRVTDFNTAPPEEVAAHMARARAEERVHFYFQHRKKSGEVADVEVHSGPIVLDGRPVLLSIINDVSERRRLEEQLRTAQRMEALGRLAGGVAHDFNNLMMVVIGASAQVALQLPEGSPLRQHVADIEQSGRRAARLTQQLLAVGSRQVLSFRSIDLNATLLGSSGMLRHVLPPNIEVAHALAEEAPVVLADPDQLDQVLLNLVVNARDAMPSGGRILLRTANVEITRSSRDTGELPPGAYVLFAVQDEGIGIEPSQLANVFEPFYTTKGGDNGTGLGLATVYGIVKQLRGHVSVESTPGVGSLFRILLPAATEPASDEDVTSRSGTATPVPRGSATVLLVDDDELVRKIVALMLTSFGYEVLAASDGERALEICAAHEGTIDVLVTDVLMPGMSGDALAVKLQSKRPEIRVLFMSGSTNNTVLPEQTLGGHVGFLQKPLTPNALAAAVHELVYPRGVS